MEHTKPYTRMPASEFADWILLRTEDRHQFTEGEVEAVRRLLPKTRVGPARLSLIHDSRVHYRTVTVYKVGEDHRYIVLVGSDAYWCRGAAGLSHLLDEQR